MAQRVIHILEMVQVDEEHTERVTALLQQFLDFFFEVQPVRERSQRVTVDHAFQFTVCITKRRRQLGVFRCQVSIVNRQHQSA